MCLEECLLFTQVKQRVINVPKVIEEVVEKFVNRPYVETVQIQRDVPIMGLLCRAIMVKRVVSRKSSSLHHGLRMSMTNVFGLASLTPGSLWAFEHHCTWDVRQFVMCTCLLLVT